MDRIDEKLLQALQRDGRISNTTLAKAVGLSESACLRRVKKLEHSGVIQGYGAIVAREPHPSDLLTIVMITLEKQTAAAMNAFESGLKRNPLVVRSYLVTGSFDYIVELATSDAHTFKANYDKYLAELPGVVRIQSCSTIKRIV